MVFYAAFNSISVISRQQLTLFMLSWISPVLGWALKCLAQGHSLESTQRIQCSSNPGSLDYDSNTLPLSHVGPLVGMYDRETVNELLNIDLKGMTIYLKGGYSDFSYLTELKNIYIIKIYKKNNTNNQ